MQFSGQFDGLVKRNSRSGGSTLKNTTSVATQTVFGVSEQVRHKQIFVSTHGTDLRNHREIILSMQRLAINKGADQLICPCVFRMYKIHCFVLYL